MSVELVAAIVALVAGVLLFIRGVMLVRGRAEGPQGQLMMWGGVAILMAGGFATSTGTQLGFFMILGAFALIGQGLAEVIRARRARSRRW